MDHEQQAVIQRAEALLQNPEAYEAALKSLVLERLVIRARADLISEAQAAVEARRVENERRGIEYAQRRFDIPPPASLTEAVSFFGDLCGWRLLPVKRVGGELLPVGDGAGAHGKHVIDDERDGDVAGRIRKHGGAYGVDVQASRLAVLVIEPDGAADFAEIERFFKLPPSLSWRVDGVEYRAYAGGRVGEWVDGMALADGVRLETVGVVRLPPSQGVEWTVTPKMFFKSLAGSNAKGIPELSSELSQTVRDLRHADAAMQKRYIGIVMTNAVEREASKGKSRK